MKNLHQIFIILIIISCQAKFNSHINQKDLPIRKSKNKDTSSTANKETNQKSDNKTDGDNGNKTTEEKAYKYEWQAFKGIIFNRDINPFAKLGKSFSDHAIKRKEKAEKKKAKNGSEPKSENKQDGADSKEIAADENDSKIKNEEK